MSTKNGESKTAESTPQSVRIEDILTTADVAKAKATIEGNWNAKQLLSEMCLSISNHQGQLKATEAAAVMRIARMWGKQSGAYKMRAPKAAEQHPDPECQMGDIVTVTATTGKRKGELVTGRFVQYAAKSGRTQILESGNGGGIIKGFFESKER